MSKSLKPKIKDPFDVSASEIEEVCEVILGPGATEVSSDGKQIFVYYKDRLSYIFSKPKAKWILHIRASLRPNAISLSSVIFYDNFSFLIGDPFECIGSDTCVYGEAALRYASTKISQSWFANDNVTFTPSELAEESYPELEFLLTNRGFRNLN
jgi:hypothetical protein